MTRHAPARPTDCTVDAVLVLSGGDGLGERKLREQAARHAASRSGRDLDSTVAARTHILDALVLDDTYLLGDQVELFARPYAYLDKRMAVRLAALRCSLWDAPVVSGRRSRADGRAYSLQNSGYPRGLRPAAPSLTGATTPFFRRSSSRCRASKALFFSSI